LKRAALIYGRSAKEYPDKSKIKYVPPPVVKEFKPKTSFVHNQVANKARVNNEHLEVILNKKVFTSRKHQILNEMAEHNIDIRLLTTLKNELFESEELIDNHLISL
jgi:hypothetical protein